MYRGGMGPFLTYWGVSPQRWGVDWGYLGQVGEVKVNLKLFFAR